MYNLFKNIAFRCDPEFVHDKSISLLKKLPQLHNLFGQRELNEKYSLNINNLKWKFPVGLAAGLDKNGEAFDFFSQLYFGSVEVGTVTPLPQSGNERPRLFRYPDEKSLRNCMGFNNLGMDAIYKNINGGKTDKILGVNLGKNKITPNKKAVDDYLKLFSKFKDIADYLVINISSPNTPSLRDLQQEFFLTEVIKEIEKNRQGNTTPIFLKIAPDLTKENVYNLVESAKKLNFAGIIATNTTSMPDLGAGGISGQLLAIKAKEVRKWALDVLHECPQMELIGVGGISSFNDILDFWRSGGRLVQIYTSFIYQGPAILADIKKSIDELMLKEKVDTLEDLIALCHRSNS